MTLQKDIEQNEKKYLRKFADFSNKRILEIGCSEGRLTWQYSHASKWTVGIDPDPNALRVATIERPSDLKNKVYFSNAQAEQLPFHKETFDIAVLAWSL